MIIDDALICEDGSRYDVSVFCGFRGEYEGPNESSVHDRISL